MTLSRTLSAIALAGLLAAPVEAETGATPITDPIEATTARPFDMIVNHPNDLTNSRTPVYDQMATARSNDALRMLRQNLDPTLTTAAADLTNGTATARADKPAYGAAVFKDIRFASDI